MKNSELAEKMADFFDDYAEIKLWYPRNEEEKIKAIEVGLMDVRAADSIRIEYDFHRDGWIIKQAKYFSWSIDDEICDRGWTEVAFIQAWALEVKREND